LAREKKGFLHEKGGRAEPQPPAKGLQSQREKGPELKKKAVFGSF